MIRVSITVFLCLTVVTENWLTVGKLQLEQAVAQTTTESCERVGRIEISPGGQVLLDRIDQPVRNMRNNETLCHGDRVQWVFGEVTIHCDINYKEEIRYRQFENITPLCKKKNDWRSGEVIVSPIGETENPRPSIRWERVDSAIAYIVSIEGPGVNWQRQVQQVDASQIQLDYPQEEESLQTEVAYTVKVEAIGSSDPIEDKVTVRYIPQ
ncbi:MAG: hypothetical protein SAL07_13985 [Oscillatoria sp. PMC 1051.18]|nr:hypothetical protein [Oscillatoria sp. PMC 1050.18]MEC5031002.1 hypothetical protein [Oscillatoria sp. PMC 1051.18]